MINLSQKQKEIVEFPGGNLLVVASAGSGKTRVLTERIIKTINNIKKGEKVIAITFSNKAADELKNRLNESNDRCETGSSAFVGTIHQFCLEILLARGSAIGLPDELHLCESYNDRLSLFRIAIQNSPEFCTKFMNGSSKDNSNKIKDLLEQLSVAKRNLKFASDYSEKPVVKKLFEEYDSLLLQQGLIDFDDILRYTYLLLTQRPNIVNLYRKIYKHIFVDEAQDLNKAQYEIIKLLAGDFINITMVGDPNQSIYGFNGSDSDFFLCNFKNDFNATRIDLNENFRSSQKVVAAAKALEPNANINTNCPINGIFEIHGFNDEEQEAEYIVSTIKNLIRNGHNDIENQIIRYEDCAILARNRYVFNNIIKVLEKENITYTLKVSAKGSFSSESDFVKAYELGLRLLDNKLDVIHLKELTKILSISTPINSFENLCNLENIDNDYNDAFNVLKKAWNRLNTNNDIDMTVSLNQLSDYINSSMLSDEERLLISEDIQQWKNNWLSYIKKSSKGERTLSNFIRMVSLGSLYTPEDKGVVLSTVHMAKGLEFNVVFVMGLTEGVFPDYRALNDNQKLVEEQHNMFVAITRSKRFCYLSYPSTKNTPWGKKNQIPSRYIKQIKSTFSN